MKVLTATAAVLLAALSIVSCASGGGGGGSPTSPSGGSTPLTITIVGTNLGNLSFSPNPADAGGMSVVFKNATPDLHRVVLNDGSVDTGDIAAGATSRAVTMPTSGTNYHCSLHANMGGAIAPASGGQPPPCEGYCY